MGHPCAHERAVVTTRDDPTRAATPGDTEGTHVHTITEWAIQCVTRDGEVWTGRTHLSAAGAQASGDRLTAINAAEWWLVRRERTVTVTTTPWRTDADETEPR
ncbi:hypothetical protein Pam4_46 [Pseudanabaena phage Pam4]|nr:hypothetical protein Pam4_46 [Pseudanabaena phage Pam4]